jgi:glycosyltransferase involved in cell wall biosynthesis
MRTLEVMHHVDRNQFLLDYCALSGESGPLEPEVESMGGTVHHIALRPVRSFVQKFHQLLQQQKYDVVHSHVHYSSGFILRRAALAGVPIRIAHFRSMDDGRGNGLFRQGQRTVMKRYVLRYATHVLAVSEGVMKSTWGDTWRTDHRFKVVYDGCDTAPFVPQAEPEAVRREFGFPLDSKLVIHIGRMAPAKNHLKVVTVFVAVARRNASARLLLVGQSEPEIERELRRIIEREHLGDRVAFAGVRSDAPRLLKAADLLLFPSIREGLPGAVLEACAAGVPVVCSDLPMISEIQRYFDNVTALSVQAGDDVWAEALNARLIAPQRYEYLSGWARTPFSIPEFVAQHEKVWKPEPVVASA